MSDRLKILITGRVQGVGFRPAVWRAAVKLGLTGMVYNDTSGVTIEIQGDTENLQQFICLLEGQYKPPLAQIKSVKTKQIPVLESEDSFIICDSDKTGTVSSEVTCDIAVCNDCLSELGDSKDFRYRYPFINCTNCGPRYSIISSIPYDRPNTTMAEFQMCPKCSAQYSDVTNRRFHAQPVACPNCGPKIQLTDPAGNIIEADCDKAVTAASDMLKKGKIVAIKGIGGFHLAVDALNENAVSQLRTRKHREAKPFALEAASIETIEKYAYVDKTAIEILTSPQAPIVILPKKDSPIADSVACGINSLGFMLCYAPLHYLIFDKGPEILVMTSANISDSPLICSNDEAFFKLGSIADAFLINNRDIYRQVDDSIVHIIEDEPVLLRRSRGFVPAPVAAKSAVSVDIFAAGADLKNTFCFVKGDQFILSEHIGDLENAEVYEHYIRSIEHLKKLFDIDSKAIAFDLHPGYFSTLLAGKLACDKKIAIQHHWAHAASVLAEHGLDEEAIAIICDGTGYGTDSAVWGCECLIASLNDFSRFGHLRYYPLSGADKAAKEAIRPLLGLLKLSLGKDFCLEDFSDILGAIEPDCNKLSIICDQMDKNLNTVKTSSLGRVFDAVGAMVGLGNYNNFEAQLPMQLESIIEPGCEEYYDFDINTDTEPALLDPGKMIMQIVSDIRKGCKTSVISAKFHNTIALGLAEMASFARDKTNINTVVLSGGVFCNRYLLSRLIKLLKKNSFSVLWNQQVPSNDGGIALGQAAIAAKIVSRRSGLVDRGS